jgi:PAS domain S-box-containing protein
MNRVPWKILIVEDDEEDFFLTSHALTKSQNEKITLEWASTYLAAQEALLTKSYDAVLVDYDLGTENGLKLIREAVASHSPIPFILLTGRGSSEIDLEAMQAGASLYLTKDEANPLLLERGIRYAIERKQMEISLHKLNEQLSQANQELNQKLIERQQDERRQSFLNQLDLSLIHTSGAAQVMDEVSSSLAGFLDLQGCYFWEIDLKNGLAYQTRESAERSGLARLIMPLTDYLTVEMIAALQSGERVMVTDVAGDRRTAHLVEQYGALGIGAFMTQPYLREGRWLAALTAFSTYPRKWDSKDEQLLNAVLARTWPRIERARAVKELKESEAFASKILSSALNGLYIYDMKAGKNIYINEQYTEITGYTLEFFSRLEERDFIHLFHPEDQPKLEAHMLEVMHAPEGQAVEFTYRFRTADDRWIWCRSRDTVFTQAQDGKVQQIIGSFLDITQYKIAGSALQENRALLESFYDNSTFFMGVVELEGEEVTILHANSATARFFGLKDQKIERRAYSELGTFREVDTLWFDNFRRSQSEAGPVRFEYRRASSSRELWLAVVVDYLGESSQGNARFSFIVEDITERKEAENLNQALSRINESLLSTFKIDEIMTRVICEASEALACESATISLRTPNGWQVRYVCGMPEEVIGVQMVDEQEPHALMAIQTRKPVVIEDAFHDERVNREHMRKWNIRSVMVVPFIWEQQATGVIFFNYSQRTHRFREQQVDFAVHLSANISLALENVRLFENIQTELVERASTEKVLRQSEKRFRELADAMPHLVWTALPNGSVDYYNQRIGEYGELAPATNEIDLGFPFLHPGDFAETAQAWYAAQEQTEIYQVEHRLRIADGSFRWHLTRGAPIYDEEGQVVKWYGASIDINEQKEVESALKRSNKELESFAFRASHDLHEPLRKIENFADLIRSYHGASVEETEREYLERMQNAAHRMREMIDSLLSLARVTSSSEPFSEVDLNSLVQTVLDDLEASLRTSGGKVEVRDLPVLRADPNQMRALLQNLVGNALKFHRPDEPPRVLLYSKAIDGGFVEVYVQDNGIGFELEDISQLFQPFKRLHGRNEYPGSGIGLAICRRIVERHGGSITAESTPGDGSTFIVCLPLNR